MLEFFLSLTQENQVVVLAALLHLGVVVLASSFAVFLAWLSCRPEDRRHADAS